MTERISGEAETRSEEGTAESHLRLRAGAPDPPDDGGTARRDRGAVRERALAMAGRARSRVSDSVERAGARLEARTGAVTAIREHPLAAAGLAFSAGFLLATAARNEPRSWVLERTRRQLRTALLGSLSAALSNELRAILGAEHGFGELLESFLLEEPDQLADFTEDDLPQ